MRAALRAIAAPRHRVVWIAGVGAAIVATVLAVSRPAALVRQDYRVYDALARWMGPAAPSRRVAIVEIDERSVSEIGQWPWRRDVIGRLIDRVREHGASAIALDFLMAEPDRFAPSTKEQDARAGEVPATQPDAALADTIGRGRVVVGYAMTFARGGADGRAACLAHPLPVVVAESGNEREDRALARASGAICNLPSFEQAAAGSGFLNAVPDTDGILRRVPLVMEYDGRIYPSLGLAAVITATGERPSALRMNNATAGVLTIDDHAVPVDGRGNLLLRYRAGRDAFQVVPAVEVLQGRTRPDEFRGLTVFVGATALGVKDVVTTPFESLVSGLEVHATVADNLVGRDFVSRPDYSLVLEAAAALMLALALTLAGAWRSVAATAATAIVCLLLLWGFTLLAFQRGVFVSPVPVTLAIVLAFAAIGTAIYAREHVRAERFAKDLSRSQLMMIESLLSLTETRDADTARHSRRTQMYTRLLAEQLASHPRFRAYLTPERIELLASLAPLHDIGKVGVPDLVLRKPAVLTLEESIEIQKHPSYGRDVIARAEKQAGVMDDPVLAMAKEIVFTHHERWDGLGYPQGLREEAIPIPGRVVAIVDVYDALVSKRVYRDPLPFEEAVTHIAQRRATHFDPAVVDAFMRVAPAFHDLLRADATIIRASASRPDQARLSDRPMA